MTAPTLQNFETLIRRGFGVANPPALQRASVAVYRLLARGCPVSFQALASALKVPVGDIVALLETLPSSAFEKDKEGRITAFIGLSLAPANHRLLIDGKTLYTWCAFDALFIPEILQSDGEIRTTCPGSGKAVTVRLNHEKILSVKPKSSVASLVSPEREDYCRDVRGTFCDHVNFFTSIEAFQAWAVGKNGFQAVPIAEAHLLARKRNQWRYPDINLKTFDLLSGDVK